MLLTQDLVIVVCFSYSSPAIIQYPSIIMLWCVMRRCGIYGHIRYIYQLLVIIMIHDLWSMV